MKFSIGTAVASVNAIAAVLAMIAIAAVLYKAHSGQPQARDFEQTREVRGIFRASSNHRMSGASIDGKVVYFSAGAFLGSSNVVTTVIPGGTRIVGRVADIKTLRGSVPVLVSAKSEATGKDLYSCDVATCLENSRRATGDSAVSMIVAIIVLFVFVGIRFKTALNVAEN